MSLIFRPDKSSKPVGREVTLAFDAQELQAFEGSAFDTAVQIEAAKYGFGQAGTVSTETLPINADTDEPMTEVGPHVKRGGHRRYVRLQKMFA